MLLIGNGMLLTRDGSFIKNGAVALEGGRVKSVGEYSKLKNEYADAPFLDAYGGLIMPGLINAHSHMYSAFARGLSVKGFNPDNFLQILEGLWWNIDNRLYNDHTEYSAYETVIECIKCGVTTIFDHHASYAQIKGSLERIAKACASAGVRSCLCFEVSDRHGEKKRDEAIDENLRFIEYASKDKSDMLKAMFGLHAPFTLSRETLYKCVEKKPADIGFHIHVAESMNDVYHCAREYSKGTVFHLHDFGILGEKTICAHCVHVNPAEIELLAATNTMVVSNPQSNMGNAVGASPMLQMIKGGVLSGLGTDAYTADMLESSKAALALMRHSNCSPSVGFMQAGDMLYKSNPEIASRFFDAPLGVLKEGAAADVAVFDYKPYTPIDESNIDEHILFGLSGRQCIHTVCNNKILMKDRVIQSLDENEIHAKAKELSAKLWKDLNE